MVIDNNLLLIACTCYAEYNDPWCSNYWPDETKTSQGVFLYLYVSVLSKSRVKVCWRVEPDATSKLLSLPHFYIKQKSVYRENTVYMKTVHLLWGGGGANVHAAEPLNNGRFGAGILSFVGRFSHLRGWLASHTPQSRIYKRCTCMWLAETRRFNMEQDRLNKDQWSFLSADG